MYSRLGIKGGRIILSLLKATPKQIKTDNKINSQT